MGNIGVMTTSESGSVPGVFDAAGQGDKLHMLDVLL